MREYICEHGIADESDLKQLAVKYMEQGCIIYAVNTSSFYCGTELNIDVQHLLELRIITESAEFKAFRSNIGTEFAWRYINDETFKIQLKNEENGFLAEFDNRVYDEEHYLDIDRKKTKGCEYTTTGGGSYKLPIENATKVKVRNYLDYDEHGIAFISDFRIMGFTQNKKGGEC